ncbi:MAG: caspase family protein [Hyphomonadaceae bacterium]|nr:caspase family protein [Hyphomonadaceae bacterium]
MRLFLAAFAACLALWCEPAEAKRIALVIANAAYRNVDALATPEADGRLVADALAAAGFDVQLGLNLNKSAMEAAIQEFAIDASQADVAVVYYAGHGMEGDGANWLIPVDANINAAADVARSGVPFELIARSLAGATVKIVALDACRDNPFAARLRNTAGIINRGLGEVELDGYVVMYSAAAGAVAQDGVTNSPFAQTFARWIGVENTDLRLLGGNIRDDVIAATAGAQRPFISASLPGGATTLAAAPRGQVRGAATTRTRAPRNFDFVRTLRDPACVATDSVSCATEAFFVADNRPVTIDDDARMRIWDAAAQRVTRTDRVPRSQYESRGIAYGPGAPAIILTLHEDIVAVPLGQGAAATHRIEHGDNPSFLFAAGGIATFAYPVPCAFGFVDLASFTRTGRIPWSAGCMGGEVDWAFQDPSSSRFVASVLTIRRAQPSRLREVVVGDYRARTILCRIAGAANDAAFDAAGDLYVGLNDGSVVRYDRACRAKQTYRLHPSAIGQLGALANGRMISRSVDGAIRIWSAASGRVERETELGRDASILSAEGAGAAILVLSGDRRLHIWAGEARLPPYVGPPGPICAGALSPDANTLYALKCEGNVELWRRQRLN